MPLRPASVLTLGRGAVGCRERPDPGTAADRRCLPSQTNRFRCAAHPRRAVVQPESSARAVRTRASAALRFPDSADGALPSVLSSLCEHRHNLGQEHVDLKGLGNDRHAANGSIVAQLSGITDIIDAKANKVFLPIFRKCSRKQEAARASRLLPV